MRARKATFFALVIATTAWAQSSTTRQPPQQDTRTDKGPGAAKVAPQTKGAPGVRAAPEAKTTPSTKPAPAAKGDVEAKGAAAPQHSAEVSEALNAGKTPAAATVEAIMEQAVLNIAARYNLNDNQTEMTRKLMKREVYRFLQEHEAEVWPVIRDLLSAQLGAKPPDSRDEVQRVGKAAKPLLELAKKAIFDANEEWRLILSPDQRAVHDFDLDEMKLTFEQIDKNFSGWEAGQAPAGPIFPPQRDMPDQPRRPKKPIEEESPYKVVFEPSRVLEALVEAFIKEYDLDEGQITAARSIVQEFKAKATDFMESKRQELAEIAKQQQEAMTKRDLDGIKKAAAAAHKQLREPFSELCAQMDERLKALLTMAQIERHVQKTTAPRKGELKDALTVQEATAKKETTTPPPQAPPAEAPRKDAALPETAKKDVPPPPEAPPAASGSQSSSDKPKNTNDKPQDGTDAQ